MTIIVSYWSNNLILSKAYFTDMEVKGSDRTTPMCRSFHLHPVTTWVSSGCPVDKWCHVQEEPFQAS